MGHSTGVNALVTVVLVTRFKTASVKIIRVAAGLWRALRPRWHRRSPHRAGAARSELCNNAHNHRGRCNQKRKWSAVAHA